jgi:hypothetical protein
MLRLESYPASWGRYRVVLSCSGFAQCLLEAFGSCKRRHTQASSHIVIITRSFQCSEERFDCSQARFDLASPSWQLFHRRLKQDAGLQICTLGRSEGGSRETPWCSPTEARHDRPERVLRAHCGLLLSCRAASLRPRLAGQTPWCAARLTGAQTDAYPACASARYALCNWMTHSVTSSLLARSTSQDTRAASGPRWRCAPVPVPHRGFATQSAILGRLRTSRQVHPQPHRPDD